MMEDLSVSNRAAQINRWKFLQGFLVHNTSLNSEEMKKKEFYTYLYLSYLSLIVIQYGLFYYIIYKLVIKNLSIVFLLSWQTANFFGKFFQKSNGDKGLTAAGQKNVMEPGSGHLGVEVISNNILLLAYLVRIHNTSGNINQIVIGVCTRKQ